MSGPKFRGRVLVPGEVSAETLVLSAPLSFWGGYEPSTGQIIDQRHPQVGEHVCGKILIAPKARGSSGTPAGIAESIRAGVGPVGIVLKESDVNVAIGALVANRLYDISVPVICLSEEDYARVASARLVSIDADGWVSIS